MGKKKNRNNHKPEPELSRRSFLKLGLLGAAGLALTGLGGDRVAYFFSGKEEPWSDPLEHILNSDNLTETFVTDKFEELTQVDQTTINFFTEKLNDYYQKLDQLISGGKHFVPQETSDLIKVDVLDPLIQHIWQQNNELSDFINKQSNNSINLKGDDFVDYVGQYFKKKGIYCAHHATLDQSGIINSQRITKIKKITHLDGQLWGNQIFQQKVYYLSWPCRTDEYSARCRLKKGQGVPNAENLAGDILVFPDSYEPSFKIILEGIKNYTPPGSVTNMESLFCVLMFQGLGEKFINQQDFIRKKIKTDLIHETNHTLFRQTYSCPNAHDLDFLNRNEMASFLTELKNEQTDFIYFTLGQILNNTTRRYQQANRNIGSFFLTEMAKNQQEYPLIDFSTFNQNPKDASSLLFQFPKLSVGQIRRLSAQYFMQSFPELKTLN